jgi:hypothetical protein
MRHLNQCIAAGNVLCGTTTNVFHLTLCHTVPQQVYFTWQCVVRWNALVVVPHSTLPGEIHWLWNRITHCHVKYTCCGTVWHNVKWVPPQPVYFTWQSVMRCHNQCLSPENVSCGTTTSVFQLAMCYAVPQPMYFTWKCAMRHHNQCIAAGNVLCGIRWKALILIANGTLLCEIHWLWYRITHCQVKYTCWLIFRLQVLTGCSFSVTWESSLIFCGYGFWKTINFCYYLVLVVRQFIIKFHRSIYTETTW